MTERLHILHVIDQLAAGGAERMVIEIANATERARYKPAICVTRSNLTLAVFLNKDVKVFSLERHRRFSFKALTLFGDFCRQENVRLLHIHGNSSFLFVAAAKALGKIPSSTALVIHEHNGEIKRFSFLYRQTLRWLNPVYAGVDSRLRDLACAAGIPEARAHFISNAIDFNRRAADKSGGDLADVKGKGLVGILLSNVRPVKNIEFFIRSAALIKEKKWIVVILGSLNDKSYVQTCRDEARRLGLEDRILFWGLRLDVAGLLKQADFGLLASKTESGPLALLEYAAAGLPFVSTRVGSIGKHLEQQGIPGFAEPGNELEFSEAIGKLLGLSPAERKQRGELGLVKAREYFDIHKKMPEWEKIYLQALGTVS